MRRTVTVAAALATAALLLTGCGGSGKDSASGKAASPSVPSAAKTADKATHTVTLQVAGEGSTMVMYNLSSDGSGTQKLPWTKTETIHLTAAEQRVGYLVSVVPGSVQGTGGTLKMASCMIKVDGRQVTDNDGGKSNKPCEYKVR
ncbi:hypothetical protein AV521_15585 [Streptomyces sp. IMTB 2501]|uniref:hypothetical protein n=1 Tax=Streptomyces sp. IMTB 2501 TaxID=1776340 RepID=UPI00096F4108|nr:hypothetical protein [Streptomyces sp. IMTB 2501]OLZ69774.1 hypothetical protein AV521_15585 [Streptomyces sp. IMTB 2501]